MKTINTFLIYCFSLLAIILPGCSSDTQLPPERPAGIVAGKIFDSAISGAQVTVYAFGDGNRGARLGGTTSDAEGNFSVDIQSKDQLILLEASGGSYVEQATGTTVTIPSGDVLQAIVSFKSGASIGAMVTPLTHLVSGLTSYKAGSGTPAAQAFTEAQSIIDQYFTLDTNTVIPVDITDSNTTVSTLSSEALYGFYLASISNWSKWASEQNKVTPHTTYTSIALTQVMYNDLRSDGSLNGIGYDLNGENLMPLAIGTVPLDANSYRAAFSLHMLAVSALSVNSTNLKPGNLQQLAQELASKPSDLFAGSAALNIDDQTPELNLTEPLQVAYSGELRLPLNVGGFLGADTISVAIDGNFHEQLNPTNPELILDTTTYLRDESHIISFSAIDILGNTASKEYTLTFDNTNPVVTVDSSPHTNITPATVFGSYSDNIAGIDSILVDGQAATLDQNGGWNASVNLTPGENIIPVVVLDKAGNEAVNQTILYLDNVPPAIDTTAGHSEARFSNGSGESFVAQLQNTNDATALYIETNRLDLMSAGIQISRQELDANLIPYFAFSVTDDISSGIVTDFADIRVRIQYEKDGEILNPWHVMPVPESGNEYLIPLASEILASDWHQATPLETHSILLEVSDQAGNVSTATFSFRADFQVPPLDSSGLILSNPGTAIFTATAFQDRATLNNREYEAVTYQAIRNPVDKSIYIKPEDDATHNVNQTIEQLVREHQYRLVTTTEWQIRLMRPSQTQPCPGDNPLAWQPVTSIFNRQNNTWIGKSVPEPVQGEIKFISSDDLPNDSNSTNWTDIQHFDQEFIFTQITNDTTTQSYHYDYVLEPNNTAAMAAFVTNWELQEGENIITCPEAQFFQQREVSENQSEPGFPKPVTSEIELANLPGFFTTGFIVFDVEADTIVQPVNGWYKIPAGHSFNVTKLVTNPNLIHYNDDISDPNTATYTPAWYDKSISWEVNREIGILVIHDSGELKIPDMSQNRDLLGSGVSSYLITR
jgi:hypothetical protein